MNTLPPLAAEFLATWKANRQLTIDVVRSLNPDDLHRPWPRPGLNTFAKHISEMCSVQEAFRHAMESGVMDFAHVPGVFEFAGGEGRDELLDRMKNADADLEETAKELDWSRSVLWDGLQLSMTGHWTNLISHEVFHQGMMAMTIYAMKLRLPESWQTNWAMPATDAKKPL